MSQRTRRLRALLLGVGAVCASLAASPLTTPALAIEGTDWQHALRVARRLRADPPARAHRAPARRIRRPGGHRERRGVGRGRASPRRLPGGNVQPGFAKPDLRTGRGAGQRTSQGPRPRLHRRQPRSLHVAADDHHVDHPGGHQGHLHAASLQQRPHPVAGEEGGWGPVLDRRRYPVFSERYAANLARLGRLVSACRARGYRPVLLDLPRNMEVIADAFDAPIAQYQEGCRALAAEHSDPLHRIHADVEFGNQDFYDLAHLVEPGRAKFQGRLTSETVRLLADYACDPAPAGTGGRVCRVADPDARAVGGRDGGGPWSGARGAAASRRRAPPQSAATAAGNSPATRPAPVGRRRCPFHRKRPGAGSGAAAGGQTIARPRRPAPLLTPKPQRHRAGPAQSAAS